MVSFPHILTPVACIVKGFLERAHTLVRLQEIFLYRHWKAHVAILQEGPSPLPRYPNFDIHITAVLLFWNQRTDRCNRAMDMRL